MIGFTLVDLHDIIISILGGLIVLSIQAIYNICTNSKVKYTDKIIKKINTMFYIAYVCMVVLLFIKDTSTLKNVLLFWSIIFVLLSFVSLNEVVNDFTSNNKEHPINKGNDD